MNLINKSDNKCSQYTTTLTLNHEEIDSGKNLGKISKIKPFIDINN